MEGQGPLPTSHVPCTSVPDNLLREMFAKFLQEHNRLLEQIDGSLKTLTVSVTDRLTLIENDVCCLKSTVDSFVKKSLDKTNVKVSKLPSDTNQNQSTQKTDLQMRDNLHNLPECEEENCEEKVTKNLKGIGIGEQIPKEFQEQEAGRNPKQKGDKTFVESHLYEGPESHASDSEEKHVSFVLFNCGGLECKICDKEFISIVNKYDIIFLTETWLGITESPNVNIDDYIAIHCPRLVQHQISSRKSGGISVFYRTKYKNGIAVIKQNDRGILWLKFCREFFNVDTDVFIALVYIPPRTSKYYNVPQNVDFDFFNELQDDIKRYSQNNSVYICGDFNSRTGNQTGGINPPRCSKDAIINKFGRRLIKLCKETDIVIANGHVGNDKGIGEFTHHNYHKGASVIDLLLTSKNLDNIKHFEVEELTKFSPHTPVTFRLELCNIQLKAVRPQLNAKTEAEIGNKVV